MIIYEVTRLFAGRKRYIKNVRLIKTKDGMTNFISAEVQIVIGGRK